MRSSIRMDQLFSMQEHQAAPHDGTIVVVAKCPIGGKSKTRLIPLLGEDGSAYLARCMLSDVLLTLEHCVSSCVYSSFSMTFIETAYSEKKLAAYVEQHFHDICEVDSSQSHP